MNTPVSFRCLKAEWIALLNQEFQFRGSPSYSRYISHPMSSKLRYNDRRIICQFVIYKFSLPRFISRTHLLKRSGRVFSLLRDVISFWIPCFHRLHEISHSHHPWHQKKNKKQMEPNLDLPELFLHSALFSPVVVSVRQRCRHSPPRPLTTKKLSLKTNWNNK